MVQKHSLNNSICLPISYGNISRRKKDGTPKSSCSYDIHNLVLHVHSLLAHGTEGRIRLENGPTTFVPRTAPFHALLLRVQKVAQCTLSIRTDHLLGWEMVPLCDNLCANQSQKTIAITTISLGFPIALTCARVEI